MRLLSKAKTMEVIRLLEQDYPEAKAELDFSNPFELLIATILSQQCTDVRVNKTTEILFEKLKTPEDYLAFGEENLKEIIRPCGFYNTKAMSILNTCSILVNEYNSQVPQTMEELTKMPGVGRKTANVVMSNCFGVDAIAVDTHVFRVSNRIGIVKSKDVYEVEKGLMKKIDKNMWTKAHHILIFHGRRTCKAQKPKCDICSVKEYCNYFKGEKA